MQSHIYVGLSAQQALLRRLTTLAQNVANVSTAGYRAEEISFSSLLSTASTDGTQFVTAGESFTSQRSGALTQTNNPLDVAVSGDGWLSVETPAGRVLTRDGRLQMTAEGELKTVTGYRVLDAGGSAIRLAAAAGPPSISQDGTISQAGQRVATLGIFKIDPEARVVRFENAGLITDKPAIPLLDATSASILQGYIERSNVDPMREMTRLIALQRTFDAISATMGETERSLSEAIRTLGSDR